MSTFEMFYLAMVLCAVAVFAGVLFVHDQQQRKDHH